MKGFGRAIFFWALIHSLAAVAELGNPVTGISGPDGGPPSAAPELGPVDPNTFLGRARRAGMKDKEVIDYLNAVAVFKKSDRLYGMPHTRWKFEQARKWSDQPEFQAALATMDAFQAKYQDKNPVTDAVNFVRERQRLLAFNPKEAPASVGFDLPSLVARQALAKDAVDNWGKNGPTIIGPGVTPEHQANHYREGSVDLQSRESNLAVLADITRRNGLVPFADLDGIRAAVTQPEAAAKAVFQPQADVTLDSELKKLRDKREADASQAQMSNLDKAIAMLDEPGLVEKVIQELNTFAPGNRFEVGRARAWLAQDIRNSAKYPSEYNWSPRTLVSFGLAHLFHDHGIDGDDFEPYQRDGVWSIGGLYSKKQDAALMADARREPVFNVSTTETGVAHFQPWIQRVVAEAIARQDLRAGVTAEQIESELTSAVISDLKISVVNHFDKGEWWKPYEMSAVQVAHVAQRTLARYRNSYFVAGPKPPPAPPVTAVVAEAAPTGCQNPLSQLPAQAASRPGFLRRLFGRR